MSDTALRTDVAPVTDRRPVPAGVLPRGMQTWLMLAVAVGMLGMRQPPRSVGVTNDPLELVVGLERIASRRNEVQHPLPGILLEPGIRET